MGTQMIVACAAAAVLGTTAAAWRLLAAEDHGPEAVPLLFAERAKVHAPSPVHGSNGDRVAPDRADVALTVGPETVLPALAPDLSGPPALPWDPEIANHDLAAELRRFLGRDPDIESVLGLVDSLLRSAPPVDPTKRYVKRDCDWWDLPEQPGGIHVSLGRSVVNGEPCERVRLEPSETTAMNPTFVSAGSYIEVRTVGEEGQARLEGTAWNRLSRDRSVWAEVQDLTVGYHFLLGDDARLRMVRYYATPPESSNTGPVLHFPEDKTARPVPTFAATGSASRLRVLLRQRLP